MTKEQFGLPVEPNKPYSYSGPAKKIYFYDETGQEVGEVELKDPKTTFSVPKKAKYLGVRKKSGGKRK